MTHAIDILLATYQGASFLDEQLASIMEQTHSHFHLIIRDDGSSDETPHIIRKWSTLYPQKMTVIPTGERLGAKGNFSELMKNSKAAYIMFADQDDYWLPEKVEVSLAHMKKLESQFGFLSPLLVHTDLKVVDRYLKEISPSFWKYVQLNPTFTSLNRLLPQNVATGCTMFMNRALLELAFPIPQEAIMHDWWIALVASCFGHIQIINQPTILYRQHGANDTGASPYSLWFHLKNFKKNKSSIKRTYQQAAILLKRFECRLTAEQQNLLKIYSHLGILPFLKKSFLKIRYQFFKQGLLRNIKLFLDL